MGKADLGVEMVSRVRRHPEWTSLLCSDGPGGFACSRFGLLQRIWSGPPLDDEGQPAWRVQVRTRFLAGFDGSPAQCEALSLDMTDSALAAVVRDPRDATRLQLASTLHVHDGNAGWAADLLALVAGLQACEARRLACTSGLLALGARPDWSAGPEPGSRCNEGDGLVERLAGAPAMAAGVWPTVDVRASVERLCRQPGVQATSTPRGLIASFASARRSTVRWRALFEVDATAHRPGLGQGLSGLLVPPVREGGAQLALSLNESEIMPGCRTDLLGGWSVREGVLQHFAFFPAAALVPGLLLGLVLAAIRRVEWIL